MMKLFSRGRFELNALDPRKVRCVEFLAQCDASRNKELSPACRVAVKPCTDVHHPQTTITYVNVTEEVADATSTYAQSLRDHVIEKGRTLSPEKISRKADEHRSVIVPEDKLDVSFPGTEVIPTSLLFRLLVWLADPCVSLFAPFRFFSPPPSSQAFDRLFGADVY
ncbi:unnamed protein product [Spirodela intermedia]|uniref:Uncharacterized protein n=2 Tax=Spirodela intermedia TaxID=51605 RepID=A0A7I8JJS4_SPIIN|nr:unnamed protein product [Spirodela intermedia]CAA6670389.1 unnamed protein product [Spirodela intermedia]CAA7407451.1 unnamed protein product [Spirodela intermedia]